MSKLEFVLYSLSLVTLGAYFVHLYEAGKRKLFLDEDELEELCRTKDSSYDVLPKVMKRRMLEDARLWLRAFYKFL